jgi:hypothetical protein
MVICCGTPHPLLCHAFNDESYYPDFKLTFESSGTSLVLHRFILEKWCLYFNDLNCTTHTTLSVSSHEEALLTCLLRSMYTCELELPSDEPCIILDTLEVAKKYQICSNIIDSIVQHLIHVMNQEIALPCFLWCKKNKQDELQMAAVPMIDICSSQVMDLSVLEYAWVIDALCNNDPEITCNMYESLYQWVSHDRKNREQYTYKLLTIRHEGIGSIMDELQKAESNEKSLYESSIQDIESDDEHDDGFMASKSWTLADSVNLNHFRPTKLVMANDETVIEQNEQSKRVTFTLDKPIIIGE